MGPNFSFGFFLGGIVLVVGGLSAGAALLDVPAPWIVVGAIVVLGLGVMAAVKTTLQREPTNLKPPT